MSGTHSPPTWAHIAPTDPATSGDQDNHMAEAQAERMLRAIAALPPEGQALLLARLLGGMAGAVTPSAAGKAVAAALSPEPEPPTSSASPRSRARAKAGQARAGRSEPALESPLADLRDRFDPYEAWERFPDAEQLLGVLRGEPVGILEAMLRHPRLPAGKPPRGKSAAALAACIVQRITSR